MPTECGSLHPDFKVACQEDKHHQHDHVHKTESGSIITWPKAKEKDVIHTKAQMLQMIGDHKVKLQQTIDELKNSSGLGKDLIDTLVPPMQTQLFFIEQLVRGMKEE